MSAPQIPNLSTLRRGGLKSRGRGSAQISLPPPLQRQRQDKDAIIRATDNDAATSRLSAVSAGYLSDPFARPLSHNPPDEVRRRLPLMNRGTYVRTFAIDNLVNRFIDSQSRKRVQIISLGAGSDTRYFRLLKRDKGLRGSLVYHELDFAENTCRKIERLRSRDFIRVAREESGVDFSDQNEFQVTDGGEGLRGQIYCIHAVDLRSLAAEGRRNQGQERKEEILLSSLSAIDTTLPTLLISECCLCYLPPSDADAVLSYFTHLFSRQAPQQNPSNPLTPATPTPKTVHLTSPRTPTKNTSASTATPECSPLPTSSSITTEQVPLAIIIYEPIHPDTPFGRTMTSNLTARGIQMQTLEKYADLDAQKQRLLDFGFSDGNSASIATTAAATPTTANTNRGGDATPTPTSNETIPGTAFGPDSMDLDSIWRHWVPKEEKERVEALEWMDEVEEFVLLGKHYCIAWGGRGF